MSAKRVTLTNQVSYRLVNSKFPPIALFDDVVSADYFETAYAIQSLTNPRILNELGDLALLPKQEIPFGIDGTSYVTAPFTHVNPDGSRFSDGSFGILYLADCVETAIKETLYHQEKYFINIPELHYDTFDMRCLKVVFSAEVADCTAMTDIYHSEDYSIPNALGATLKKANEQGVQYNSVRNNYIKNNGLIRSGNALCWGLFSPKYVSCAIQTKHFEFVFDGEKIPYVRELVNSPSNSHFN